jgi:hypothetical protein
MNDTRQLFTGCWFERYPSECIKIGISRGTPRGTPAGYRLYRKLAPGTWFNSVTPDVYKERYFDILGQLDPMKVMDEVFSLAKDKTPLLVCYESPRKPADWCHRGYVSAWFADTLAISVPEYGFEKEGSGWQHPKLPRAHRREPLPLFKPIDLTGFIGKEATDQNGKVWTVVGPDPDHADQALVKSGEDLRSISEEVLKRRFGQ